MTTLTINGIPCPAEAGDSILRAAARVGVAIPTLCADGRLKHFTSCFVCVVEVEGAPGFKPACSTAAADGMAVRTDTDGVRAARRWALDLLLSNHFADCIAPCQIECPAHVDVQGYIAHVANGDPAAAVEVVRRTNPFPLSTGKICTHPCETGCRRNHVDQPVAIRNLKRHAVDGLLARDEAFPRPAVAPDSGRRVAVVGAGPAGLACAYFLRILGHAVTVYERMERPGGMLRYGIPEYRLPKAELDHEIGQITTLGIPVEYGRTLGVDLRLTDLLAAHDAVFLGLGAWRGTPMKIEGERGPGVLNGIEFLRRAVRGEELPRGESIVVVGGGNTAIDVARTARRLGFAAVRLAYRRSRAEMPADPEEIEAAAEEGVEFHFLTAPVRVERDPDGRVRGLVLQRMELGEPDASGRRRPVPVAGSDFLLEGDAVVSAIGQAVDTAFISGCDDPLHARLDVTRWGTLTVGPDYQTSVPGIYAGGDLVLGPKAAIDAIAQGKEAAYAIDCRLDPGRAAGGATRDPYRGMNVRREDFGPLTPDLFAAALKVPRTPMRATPPPTRTGFDEVELGYDPAEAAAESARCLECGCQAVFACDLRRHATEFGAKPGRFPGAVSRNRIDASNPFITREMDKCILCGTCVRLCDEHIGVAALSFARRGFGATVEPTLGRDLAQSTCITCGLCAAACPTGALHFRPDLAKPGPFRLERHPSTCNLCAMGCRVDHEFAGRSYAGTRSADRFLPNGPDLCGRGHFGLRSCGWQGSGAPPDPASAATTEIVHRVREAGPGVRVLLSPRLSVEEGERARRAFADGLAVRDLRVAGAAVEGEWSRDLPERERRLPLAELAAARRVVLFGDDWDDRWPLLYPRLFGSGAPGRVILVGRDPANRLTPKCEKVYPAGPDGLAPADAADLAGRLADDVPTLLLADVAALSAMGLLALRAYARATRSDLRFLDLAGNAAGLRLAGIVNRETPAGPPPLLVTVGHVDPAAVSRAAAGAPILVVGGRPFEHAGTFVNLEGRVSRIAELPFVAGLGDQLRAIAEAAGLTPEFVSALALEPGPDGLLP